MTFTQFDKRGDGVQHHFLKIRTDAVKRIRAYVPKLNTSKLRWKNYEYKFQIKKALFVLLFHLQNSFNCYF